MANPQKRLLRSTSVLVIGTIWEFLNHWSLLDAVLSKLKAQGGAGLFIANVITSLPLRLTLIGLGFVMAAKAYFFPSASVPDETEKDRALAIVAPKYKNEASSIVTPKYIVGFFDDHTHIQAESLIKPLIGQMIEVSGPVREISSGWDYILVQISDSEDIHLALSFSKSWADKLSILKRGHKIVAIGKIRTADSLMVHLEDCELRRTYL